MDRIKSNLDRIKELEALLEVSERKSDILTNLLKEASAEFEHTFEQIKISESNSRYKELFKNVSDPVFINDLKGGFLEINDVACECFGFPRDKLLQMDVKDLTKPAQLDILLETGKRVQQGKTVQFELDLVIKRGVTIPFEFHARLIQFKGQPAVLSVARNLSVRKKMEETLIKTERLSAVGEMASGVAHNFNNLLQMIMGGAEAALAKLDSGKIRECREAVGNILNASRRGADVVRRIKDFTAVKTAQLDEANIFDLDELIKEAVELTKTLWKEPAVPRKYRVNYIKGGKIFVKGQPSEIYEVMVNLIKNGLEAMPHGGFLTISTARQNGNIHLTVSDSGHGIREAHFQRIFEPFFTTKGSKSSGLGLSSCYGIVKKHQGDMHVRSIPGQGTSFTMILPLTQPPDEQKRQELVPIERHKLNFLVIDDEVNILKMMEMFFEDTEVDIVTALTAEEGLRAIRRDDFDAVLCDLGMDDMNGLEVGQKVKEYFRKAGKPKIPFLLYTGLENELDPKKLSDHGIDRVVKKPIPCEDLLRLIQEVSSPPMQAKRTA